jgi:dTDP-4-amino-4,6-dideoxygalactose transaminase
MTDFQAALGLSQHNRLDEFVARRRQIARTYGERLADLPVILPLQHPDAESAFHLYAVQIDSDSTLIPRRRVFERLRKAGIGVNVHYIPVHTQPYYRGRGFRLGQYPEAEKYYSRAISLPMYAALETSAIDRVTAALRDALN